MSEKIIIFDTTLRDGEQSPGASMNMQEKFRLAQQLVKLKVDVIEAGFPVASPGDFECVRNIAEHIRGAQIAALARCSVKDIDRAWEALKAGENPRIHTFLATSDIHLKHKLKMNRDQVLELAVASVKHAARYTSNVEFSAEDASRSDLDFVCKVFAAVIEAGATTLNFPDTTGYALPDEFGRKIGYLIENIPNIHKAVLSVHCHNDLGLAVANSLAAINHGARQVESTINGLGERAGNTAMEELVMVIRTRADQMQVHTDIVTEHIYPTSRLVSTITGMAVQANKAIVGANAFAHESGIHQDGVLKERTTYEIMRPQDIGLPSNKLVLGKLSGRHAFVSRMKELGFALDDAALEKAFAAFKNLADLKKIIFDEDLLVIVDEQSRASDYARYNLEDIFIRIGQDKKPSASIRLRVDGDILEGSGTGDGALDAAFSVIKNLTNMEDAVLVDYHVGAVTRGTDALASVNITIRAGGREALGRGPGNHGNSARNKACINP